MSHGLILLLIATGAIITCIVVVVGFGLTDAGTGVASEVKYGLVDADHSKLITDNTSIDHSVQEDDINPNGKFVGAIKCNANGVIDQIIFTQQ